MPALSQAQQRLFAIAEHDPGKLHKANRGLLRMSKDKLHDFAATPRTGLPQKKGAFGRASERQGK